MCNRHLPAQIAQQIGTQFLGSLVAGVGILLHGTFHDRLETGGDVGIDPARWHRVLRHMLVGNRHGAFACERRLAAQQLVEDHSKRVDI